MVILLIAAGLAGVMFIHPAVAQPSTDWPMFRFNPQHAGATQSVTPPLELKWNFTTGGNVYSSPAVSGDFVFVSSYDGKIYALYAANGTQRWSYTTGFWAVSSPAVSGGVVYVGSYDKKVYALDAATGTLKWNFTTGGIVGSSPAVSGGFVYVGSDDGNLYALDASTGTLKWNYTTGGYVESSPVVSGSVVYVGSWDGNVYALDAVTGARKWNYTTGGYVYSSPAVSNGIVYVGSEDSNLYALDATTGALKWSYPTGAVYSSPAVSGGLVYVGSWKVYAFGASTGTLNWSYVTKGGNVYSSPAVSGGVVYVGSDDDNIYALNAYTGACIWNYTTGELVESSPAVSGGFVYVGSYDGKVYAFSPIGSQTRYAWPEFHHDITHTGYCESPAPRTNHTMWNYTTGLDVGSSPAVADGIVYVGSYDNNVYALNASSGALVWNYTTGGAVSSSPAVADGKVYVGSYDGRVYCLDAITAALVWNFTTGGYVRSSPAVDYGKVYVGSDDNKTYCLDSLTGVQIWNYTTNGWVLSSPTVADGKVYVGSLDYEIYCLDASTGLQVWNYATGDFVYSSSAIADGMVFMGSADFTLYAFGEIVRTEDYETVQEAINAAPPEAIVLVAPGIYNEPLVINTTLTILGRLGSEPTFEGGGCGIAITIVASASGSIIAGITITNWDQGILVNGASGCKIFDNIMSLISQNGITLQGSNASNTVIYSNIFEKDTIAVSLTSSSSNNIIYGNVISLSSIGLNLQSSNNIVYANIMTYNAIAINMNNSNNNKFFHNNFDNFTLNISNSTGNAWDDGYPSGGNYWSDYLTKYPNATQNGSSGTWDTPYVVATDNVDHYPLARPFSMHNIGMASLVVSKTVIGLSYKPPMSALQISLKILNLGTYDETFTVAVSANSTLIIQQTVSLSRGDYTTFTLTWNTAGCVIGNYTISATADPVPSEGDSSDNSRSSRVTVTIPGDVKGDFVVNILDAILLSNAYNSYPGRPNWNPNADVNGDNTVNILDAIILSNNYNQHYP